MMSITVDLSDILEERLRARAASAGVPLDAFVRSLLEAGLAPVPLADAVRLYSERKVSQGQAAAMAGVSRAELIEALSRAGVSPFQYSADEVLDEASIG